MAETLTFKLPCKLGGAGCGRCTEGRDQRLRALLHEMQALGDVLPGHTEAANAAPEVPVRREKLPLRLV